MNILKTKIDGFQYKTSIEFMYDVLLIQHNCLIFTGNLGDIFSNDNSIEYCYRSADFSERMDQITKKFVAFCEKEILLIKACEHCYEEANLNPKWFTNICSRLHPVVWAKLPDSPYQPAKVMSVHHKTVTVCFFGDYKVASVQSKFCLAFSESNPNRDWQLSPYVIEVIFKSLPVVSLFVNI